MVDGMHEAVIKIGALSAVRELPVDPGLAGRARPVGGTPTPLLADSLSVTYAHPSSATESEAGDRCAHSRPTTPVSLSVYCLVPVTFHVQSTCAKHLCKP